MNGGVIQIPDRERCIKEQQIYFSLQFWAMPHGVRTCWRTFDSLIIDKCPTFTQMFDFYSNVYGLIVNENNRSHKLAVVSACGVAACWVR